MVLREQLLVDLHCSLAVLLSGCTAALLSQHLSQRCSDALPIWGDCPMTVLPCCTAELHVLDGAAQTIFVRANYVMEVR